MAKKKTPRVKSKKVPARTKRPADKPLNKTPRLFQLLLLVAFFISGATSLALEVAWSKQLSYLLGVDIYAATTVVTAFMFGLGLGALLVSKYYRWPRVSIRAYGYLQIAIGICGMLSIPMLRATSPLFSFLFVELQFNSHLFVLVRFVCVFAMMLIPVTLMGMTLPIVVGASFGKTKTDYARLAGQLYGVNTVGAVCGTLAAGFLLVPGIGILKTCLFTGATDLILGVLILLYAATILQKPTGSEQKTKTEQTKAPQPVAITAETRGAVFISWPVVIFFLSGIVALAYEIIWFRLLARVIGPSVHAFSIMLAVYLLGIGSGSLIGARLIRKTTDYRLSMSVLLFLIGIGPLASLLFINQLPVWYGNLFISLSSDVFTVRNLFIQGLISALLILPATLPLGAFFPVVTRAYNLEDTSKHRPVESSVGRLYFYNTLGGVIGSLMAGFYLIPSLGIRTSLIMAGFINILLAIGIFWFLTNNVRWQKITVSLCAVILSLIIVLASPRLDQQILNAGLYSEMLKKKDFKEKTEPQKQQLGNLIYFREGINNSVAIVANKFDDGNLTLHLSGSWVSSTEIHGRLHLEFLGHLPMLFARNPETIGVIGYGAGITTGNVLLYPGVKRVNVFELEPGVINASTYFEMINNRPLDDTRMHLYMVDGRSHITYGGIRYDVITSDPIHPFMAGSSNLYTVDFYRIIKEQLNEGGILCQWIPMVAISSEAYNKILNTMHSVFPHLALFSFFGESVVLASVEPLQIDWAELERRFYSPDVYQDFKALDFETPFNLISFFMGAEGQLNDYLEDVRGVNSDDNVWLEHRIPHDVYDRSLKNLYFMLASEIKKDNLRSLKQILTDFPVHRLQTELAGLSKNGDLFYEMAQTARQNGDFETMERFYRVTFSDFNSQHNYKAGLRLARYLGETSRTDEAISITRTLQKNYPAYPEAYLIEFEIHKTRGQTDLAYATLSRGATYNPSNRELIEQLNNRH